MSLIPYRKTTTVKHASPLNLIEDLQSDLNRFFDSSLLNLTRGYDSSGLPIGTWLPSTDIHDSVDKLVVTTDLPGVDKINIEVSVQGKTLFIKGEKKLESSTQDMGCLRSERFHGQFERALPLSEDIDASKIEANYQNGVLSVSIPKREEAKPKQIKVNVK